MKMFDMMRPDTRGLNLDNNPVITAAVGNDYFFNDYVITHGDMSEYQLMEDLYETGYIPAAYEYHESSEYEDWHGMDYYRCRSGDYAACFYADADRHAEVQNYAGTGG